MTLAFITADPTGQVAWGGYNAYALDGGSQISYINNQITNMHNAGIDGTISFGGAAGTDLAYTATNASALAKQYEQVVNTYQIYKLDFDVEGAMQGNSAVVTKQAQAIALLQQQQAALGKTVEVSYTLPVMPTGLVEGSNGGMNVLNIAKASGVDITRVNIMTMDYYDPSVTDMGDAAIQAATATHGQLLRLYPSMSSSEAWDMIGVTPLIGVNDNPTEIFTLADAQELTNFAHQKDIGELSMWQLPRDMQGRLGVPNGLDGSGIVQTPFAFTRILGGYTMTGQG